MTSPRPSLTVRDLMTTVVMALAPSDTLDAARVEMKFGHVRHLPVIDDAGHVVGMVSQRDLRVALLRDGGGAGVPVGPHMTTGLELVTPDTPLVEAIALLIERGVGALPVVDAQGSLVGILTETDFARHVYRELSGRDFVPSWERQRGGL